MKKLKAVLFALAVAAPFAVGATPAGAQPGIDVDACVGYWGVHTPVGFGDEPGTSYQIGFSSQAVCPGARELNGFAWVTGSCGLASGRGSMNGFEFDFSWTGGVLHFYGQVNGTLEIVLLDTNCFGADRSVSPAAGALYVSE